jgi:hypothetical protein
MRVPIRSANVLVDSSYEYPMENEDQREPYSGWALLGDNIAEMGYDSLALMQ